MAETNEEKLEKLEERLLYLKKHKDLFTLLDKEIELSDGEESKTNFTDAVASQLAAAITHLFGEECAHYHADEPKHANRRAFAQVTIRVLKCVENFGIFRSVQWSNVSQRANMLI